MWAMLAHILCVSKLLWANVYWAKLATLRKNIQKAVLSHHFCLMQVQEASCVCMWTHSLEIQTLVIWFGINSRLTSAQKWPRDTKHRPNIGQHGSRCGYSEAKKWSKNIWKRVHRFHFWLCWIGGGLGNWWPKNVILGLHHVGSALAGFGPLGTRSAWSVWHHCAQPFVSLGGMLFVLPVFTHMKMCFSREETQIIHSCAIHDRMAGNCPNLRFFRQIWRKNNFHL